MSKIRRDVAPSRDISRLIGIMAALRTPETGCPWDLEQDFRSIAPYTIEEAYEVADAIERDDLGDLKDELGDLLLQVVFHARMAEERGAFDFGAVVEAITAKLLRRHPHVFGDIGRHSPAEVEGLWARIKAEERQAKQKERQARGATPAEGVLANIPVGLPALTRALKLQQKASTVGFDWNDPRAVLAKIREEADEIEQALETGDKTEIVSEIGDLLFALVNLARHADADPESTLRQTNAKFERRFRFIEEKLGEKGRPPADASLEEMDRLWDEAKAAERSPAR
ncbi:MAG: nucleoside triphosphate pyrophosphohydrolase [Methylobacteriaceae bacterium]|nr:nucleoside triphosphate pyrophosphohydrolase [Methylobacteriaceae bacterium]